MSIAFDISTIKLLSVEKELITNGTWAIFLLRLSIFLCVSFTSSLYRSFTWLTAVDPDPQKAWSTGRPQNASFNQGCYNYRDIENQIVAAGPVCGAALGHSYHFTPPLITGPGAHLPGSTNYNLTETISLDSRLQFGTEWFIYAVEDSININN